MRLNCNIIVLLIHVGWRMATGDGFNFGNFEVYFTHECTYMYIHQNGVDLDPSMFNPSGTKGGPGNAKLRFSLNYLLQL